MRTIGIIGGMGPLATVDLYAKIVYAAQGKKDGDHVPVLLSGRPDIPDRAASICGTGPSALPALLEEARRLEQAGADALCLGCNTAHFYYNALAAAIGIPIFHMPRLAGAYCQHKRLHKVILLAAPGTYETGIYEKAFSGTGVEIIRPEPVVQRLTAQCIYEGIKACRRDYDAGALQAALLSLLKREQAPLLLGCTELPIAWRWYGLPGETIDPGEILAQAVVRWAQGGAGESFFPQPH